MAGGLHKGGSSVLCGQGTVSGARRWLVSHSRRWSGRTGRGVTPSGRQSQPAGNVGSMQSTTACLLRLPKALLTSNCKKQGVAQSCCTDSRCANIAVGPFEIQGRWVGAGGVRRSLDKQIIGAFQVGPVCTLGCAQQVLYKQADFRSALGGKVAVSGNVLAGKLLCIVPREGLRWSISNNWGDCGGVGALTVLESRMSREGAALSEGANLLRNHERGINIQSGLVAFEPAFKAGAAGGYLRAGKDRFRADLPSPSMIFAIRCGK
eukprot:845473-Amphidinium_carterae.2